jgi:AcrR family transcriptional regulator
MSTRPKASGGTRPQRVPPPKLRPPGALHPRSVAKRQHVLDGALALFATRGFDGSSMRDLAREAGVSTATIYAHFPTKVHLLEALIDARWQQALLDMLVRAAEVRDPLDRLVLCVTDLNRAIAGDPLLRLLLVTPRRIGDARVEERVAPMERMMDARCVEQIRAAVAAKRLTCEDPEALAVLIRVSMQGWLLTEARRRRPMSEARVTGMLMQLLRAASRR